MPADGIGPLSRMRVDYYHPGTMAGDGKPMRGSRFFDLRVEDVPEHVVVTGGKVFETQAGRALRERKAAVARGGYD